MAMNLRGSKRKGTLEKLESLEQNCNITRLLITIVKYTHISSWSAMLMQYVDLENPYLINLHRHLRIYPFICSILLTKLQNILIHLKAGNNNL